MQVDHDLNNKIITISQPGHVATILDLFNINKISSKYPPKVPFSHYDIADDHPVPLSKQDQSLFMRNCGLIIIPFNPLPA